MIKVTVKENESIDRALKRFKKKLERSGTLREYRRRKHFIKPSDQKRNQEVRAAYREKMRSREE